MQNFVLSLKLLAPVFFVVAALHLTLGLGAEAMLGAQVSPQAAAEPTLDSQNRFYGVAFALYGAVFRLAARDLARFEPLLRASLWVFFAAGLARLVSWLLHGPPAPLVIVLAAVELLAPPLLLLWLRSVTRSAAPPQTPPSGVPEP